MLLQSYSRIKFSCMICEVPQIGICLIKHFLLYLSGSRTFCCEIHSIFRFNRGKRIYGDVLTPTTGDVNFTSDTESFLRRKMQFYRGEVCLLRDSAVPTAAVG